MTNRLLARLESKGMEIHSCTLDGNGNLVEVNGKKISTGYVPKNMNEVKARLLNKIATGLDESVNYRDYHRSESKSIVIKRNLETYEIGITAKKARVEAPTFSDPADPVVKGIRSYVIDRLSRIENMELLGAAGSRVYARMPAGDFEIKIVKKRRSQ